jgi:hypothetical protein
MGFVITMPHRVRFFSSTNFEFRNLKMKQRGKLAIGSVDITMANNEATQTAEVERFRSMNQPSVHGSIDTVALTSAASDPMIGDTTE